MYLDVGESSNNLLLRGEIGALLELEVTYRAGQGEVAVHAAKVDEASRGLDTCLLSCRLSAWSIIRFVENLTLVLGLVVEGKRLRAAFYAQDCTRITRVGLAVSACCHEKLRVVTYDVDLVLGENTD